jgi:hypothetical protein
MRDLVYTDRVSDVAYLTGGDAAKAEWVSHGLVRVDLRAFSSHSLATWTASTRHGSVAGVGAAASNRQPPQR